MATTAWFGSVDTFDNSTDRHIALMLAQAVPGAVDAETKSTGNDRSA